MPTLERLSADALRDTVIVYRDTLKAHSAGINRLNVYPVPDGDTGTNMARTLDAVVAELEHSDPAIGTTCAAISHGSLMGARGNSGVILSQILRGIANTLKDVAEAGAPKVAEALKAASAAAYQSVLKPIEGTILTVVRVTADAAQDAAGRGETLSAMLHSARNAGRKALAETPDMLPALKDAGVVDAGGAGFLLLMDSVLHVVEGEPLPEPDLSDGPNLEQLASVMHRGDDDISNLRYEVMFFLDLADATIEQFKQAWGEIGDSIVVVGGDGLWNCHVHTNDIGAAVEAALDSGGRPRRIRVTDLFEEVAEEHAAREAAVGGGHHSHGGHAASMAGLPHVTCAVVAVSSGSGISELFGQLGVQGVVTGGQTLNPSTAELLSAVEAVNADEVVVLPNNKNIIPVAEQLAALTSKRVIVVPSRSMPEALAALVVYDPESDAVSNAAEMSAAAASVATGEVTQAVRDTHSDVGEITTGDWIGIVRGDGIVSIGASPLEASQRLLSQLLTEDRELLTLIIGNDAERASTDALTDWLAATYPHVQVETHRGAQPLYPFLFGVE